MRCMNRNKVKFFYALYLDKTPIKDDYGNDTGEYEVKHGSPMEFYGNISAAKGETQTRQFGENEIYDKVIVMDENAPPINEYSILWVDSTPTIKEDGTTETPHDYIVKKVAKSLNVVSVAISKVVVSG